jgi:hypothetical protein
LERVIGTAARKRYWAWIESVAEKIATLGACPAEIFTAEAHGNTGEQNVTANVAEKIREDAGKSL